MEVLSLGQYPRFFGMPSANKSLSNENICAALKARKGTKTVKLLGRNLAILEEVNRSKPKLIKYYTCRETLADKDTGRGGNALPWYQISKATLETLKAFKHTSGEAVEEVILLYWTQEQHSFSAAFALDDIAKQWKKQEGSKRYRLNYQRDKENADTFSCELNDDSKSVMKNDGRRQIAKDVDVG